MRCTKQARHFPHLQATSLLTLVSFFARPVRTLKYFHSDRDDHYWSGYYTSRPHYKRFDRQLMHMLRSAEQLYAHALTTTRSSEAPSFFTTLYEKLTDARRQLALFQHHDGVTGTAKDEVINDYGKKFVILHFTQSKALQNATSVC